MLKMSKDQQAVPDFGTSRVTKKRKWQKKISTFISKPSTLFGLPSAHAETAQGPWRRGVRENNHRLCELWASMLRSSFCWMYMRAYTTQTLLLYDYGICHPRVFRSYPVRFTFRTLHLLFAGSTEQKNLRSVDAQSEGLKYRFVRCMGIDKRILYSSQPVPCILSIIKSI